MSLPDGALRDLAHAAGLATHWEDAFSKPHDTGPDALHAVLAALGLDAGSEADARERMRMLREERDSLPPLLAGDAGSRIAVPGAGTGTGWRMRLENEGTTEGR
ncbi:MAG: 4-alpha-glucanotransferase, partial [Gluconacetobacter diazotrophicus]|nr:4-alpha-glucanotransferase [Gluconacetobacter diazotrophicus]